MSPNILRVRPLQQTMQDPAATDDQYYVPSPENQLVADPSKRTDISFPASDGVSIVGHLYRPAGATPGTVTPAVAVCGPISAVKEEVVPHYAERLAAAGYTVVTFDPRGFGASSGPRGLHKPERIVDDYHAAVRYLFSHAGVDNDRVAALGVCMGGGYAVSLGAREKRLKAVIAVAGGYNIGGTFVKLMGAEKFGEYQQTISNLVDEHFGKETRAVIPTVLAGGLDKDNPVAVMPNAEAASFYLRKQKSVAPSWSNDFDARSLESYLAYNSIKTAALVAPTPLMFIHGTTDLFLLPEFAEAAYEAYPAAEGKKEFVWVETHNHIELYDQAPYVPEAVEHAVRWLDTYCKETEEG